jgi:hypothetical protein
MAIDFDSPDWGKLADAFGSAACIPALLERLQTQDLDALDELYTRICHQGSVYSASFAAFPRLVQIAKSSDVIKFRADILSLVGAIYESPYVAIDSTADIFRVNISTAVNVALELTVELLPKLDDVISSIYLWKSAAAFAGFLRPARVLEGFVDKEFCLECPNCCVELYIWPSERGMTSASEDPVMNPNTKRIPVAVGPIPESPQYRAFTWLSQLAEAVPSLSGVSAQLPHLFGTATCPACEFQFSLMDELVENEAQ